MEAFELRVRVELNYDAYDDECLKIARDIVRAIEDLGKKDGRIREIAVYKICFG